MQNLVANVENIKFDLEEQLDLQIGAQPLPFPGMDKSCAAVCQFFKYTQCANGAMCPYRHVRGEKTVVCKHWLRGLCKKGDECEFLHQYDMTKMPECFFFTKFGMCSNKECPFLHIDPMSKMKDCAWYDRGFCKHGPLCKNRHIRRVMCQNYLNGFCLDGPNCKFQHPKWDLPLQDMKETIRKITCHNCGESGHKAYQCTNDPQSGNQNVSSSNTSQRPHQSYHGKPIVCHNCHEPGHKAYECPATQSAPQQVQVLGAIDTNARSNTADHHRSFRAVDTVTCFKCGNKGHYANKCPTIEPT
ncbi:cleavage and polyadenylation specificity factor subunit 4-like [Amphiura filiformis]|uniref:cleavage and polyadenylation specificity factor subunit 4-like n=1 Tax=Amphiura filiformis TaxID=82378 RepID=UPI003B228F9E